jgi:hypothetical protein
VLPDDVNIFGGSEHPTKKNKEALLVASKEIGLEQGAEKTKNMAMSRGRDAGQNYNIKIHNKSFETVEHFKYVETNFVSFIPSTWLLKL